MCYLYGTIFMNYGTHKTPITPNMLCQVSIVVNFLRMLLSNCHFSKGMRCIPFKLSETVLSTLLKILKAQMLMSLPSILSDNNIECMNIRMITKHKTNIKLILSDLLFKHVLNKKVHHVCIMPSTYCVLQSDRCMDCT